MRASTTHIDDRSVSPVRLILVQEILEGDPAGAFARSDYATRVRYESEVKTLARWSGKEVEDVARAVCRLALEAGGDPRRSHVGYYLIAEGRRVLESTLRCRVPIGLRFARALRRHLVALYLAAILSPSLLLIAGALALLVPLGHPRSAALTAILLFPVSVRLTSLLVEALVSILLYPPRALPKLDFSGGIPKGCETVIVYPVLVASPDDIHEVLKTMDSNYRSNSDPRLTHALLSDFADAPCQHMPEDAPWTEQIKQTIQALNAQHGTGRRAPFCHLHRERRWNARAGVWMGRERKRGKLMEFFRLLRGDDERSFVWGVGDESAVRDVRYVIAMDADTQMTPGSAARLVGTIAHPLNRASWNEASKRVEAGYSVIQPRVEVDPLSPSTFFSAYMTGAPSELPRNPEARTSFYQDVFGEGLYFGKAIIDLASFERSLTDRIPENSVLSHDKLEGMHARTAFAMDILFCDEAPINLVTHCRRLHRWVRGDVQLLPWLLPWVRNRLGWGPNPLPALARWTMFDDLLGASRTPAIFALLVLGGLGIVPGPVWAWMGILLGVMALPMVVGPATILGLGPLERLVLPQSSGPLPPSILGSRRRFAQDTFRWEVRHWLLEVAFLAELAIVNIDAIARGLLRLVHRRRLLEWTPSAHARHAGKGARAVWREMWRTPLIVGCVAGSIACVRPAALLWMSPLLTLWFFSPWLAHHLAAPRRS